MTGAVSADNRLPGTYEVIVGQCAPQDACQPTPVKNLYAMAGNINLAGLNIELVNEDSRESFFKDAITPIENDWEYILVDCPPSLGLVTMNAMCWAEYVVIPMQCEYLAMEGLNMLMRTIANIKKSLNPRLTILGILFTMYSKRTKLANDVVEDITSFFPDLVFKTIIPRNVRLSEAPSHGLPINAYDASSAGTKSYMNLAEEVVSRVRK